MVRTWAMTALLGALAWGCVREAKPVTFSVSAEAQSFGEKGPIRIAIWDAEQLARAEKTADCSVSSTGETNCPPGVAKAAPEERTVTREELAKGVTIVSKTVTVGERYRVDVHGPAADGCNTTTGREGGVASNDAVQISKLDLAQTEMACRPPRN
ncbi:hypothetical protein LVJ94_43815 [Pendulispora rubella]|uniref:Uncharacterized protein n=1 Tax=Pendulispora rubella TaxID=2741070 RepID=A0ABZ2L3M4_9BACT